MNNLDKIEEIDKKINKINRLIKKHTLPYIEFTQFLLLFSCFFSLVSFLVGFLFWIADAPFFSRPLHFIIIVPLIMPFFNVCHFLLSKKRNKVFKLNKKMNKKIKILKNEKEHIIKQIKFSELFEIKDKIESEDTISSILTSIEDNKDKDLDLILLDTTFEKLKRNRTISSDSRRDLEFFIRLYREEKKINDKNNIEKRIQKITNEKSYNIENE